MRLPAVSIAVKPNSNNEVPEEAQRLLRNELQVKYLESIGATPTKANLAMLRKNIPPEAIRITTAWKSNLAGEPDYLNVFFEDPQSPVEKSPQRTRLMDGSALLELSSALESAVPAETLMSVVKANEGHENATRSRVGEVNFDDAQRAYLYPFKSMRSRRRDEQKLTATHPHVKKELTGRTLRLTGGEPSDAPPRKYVSRDPLRYQMHADEDVELELHEELQLHTKEIVTLQALEIRLASLVRDVATAGARACQHFEIFQ